ncbi:MAG: hypothetical protein GY815_15705 [Gammaproteobacteria bacterium]|nr:hypothetical protein [Gammaproteobacteria bacterium]
MNWRRHIPDHAVTTVPVLAVLVAAHFFLLRDDPVEPGIEASSTAPMYFQHWQPPVDQAEFDIDGEMARLELDDARRDRQIRDFLHQRKFAPARTLLLEVAAAAVSQDDQDRPGDTLLLLGEVAINQQELAAAEIYLQEALYLTMSRDNVLGTARCYQLLGQLNIRARELARRASNTYDQLWQARNSIARGYYQGVNENLQAVIDENLGIRRYGAAADAWEALASLHDKVHDGYQAQQARLEAARLFASTGQMTHVHRLLDNLDRSLISDGDLVQVEGEINDLFKQHQQDLIQTSQARDYQMLYHHYLRIGQVERAWKFRIKSSETLANTSDRSMFQRQADIIAVLYNSNFAIGRAKNYLDQAGRIYEDKGVSEMLQQTRDMETLIW